MGAIMESTEASWVSMIMDRLQVLEQANDRLEKELDDRYPKKASTPDVEIDVRDPSDKESTYFKVAVFTDRPWPVRSHGLRQSAHAIRWDIVHRYRVEERVMVGCME